MSKTQKELATITLIALISTVLLWLPFFGNFKNFLGFSIPPGGMKTVSANYDGPNYIIIAKTWYQKSLIAKKFSLPLPLEYYPAHFPGYPFLIWLGSSLLPPIWAMLLITLLTTCLAGVVFYFLIKEFGLSRNPLWLTFVFLFFPARFFVVRSIGAPEPLFITSLLASLFFFKKKSYWQAGLFGALAQLTKTPGILLFLSLGLYLIYDAQLKRKPIKKALFRAYPLVLIPLSALGVFGFYALQTGDFLAYFHSGDNFHLTVSPFQSFNSSRSWLGEIWVEDMIWLYLIGALGVVFLFKQKLIDLGIFAGLFYLATVFVAHRDISRYLLPAWPFFLIGFDRLVQKKEFKIAFLFILPAIYFFSLNFILGNTAPIADWTPYL